MCFPSIRLFWADQGYSGTLVTWAATSLNITLQIVSKLADQTGFVVLHRRWAVERAFSWLNCLRGRGLGGPLDRGGLRLDVPLG
jgi:putative transposase